MKKLYKTELHCHTCTVSSCATDSPEHLIENYLKHGYTTIVVTDHFQTWYLDDSVRQFRRNGKRNFPADFDFSIIERAEKGEMTWKDKVDFFLSGYRHLREIAPKELTILLGAETRQPYLNCEHLLYGLKEEFLYSLTDMDKMNIYNVVEPGHRAGILFFAAHPFRNWMNVSDPDLIDGIEVFNGALNHNSRNEIAEEWAERFGLMKSSGTDYHDPQHVPDGGILTEEPILSTDQLRDVLLSGKYSLIREIPETGT